MTEVVVGMLSYTYYQDVRNDLSENLPLTLQTHYLTDPVMSQQIDWIQSRVCILIHVFIERNFKFFAHVFCLFVLILETGPGVSI